MTIPHPLFGAMFDLPLADGRVRARCISSADFNWSLGNLYRPEDLNREQNIELVARLCCEFTELGITRAYGPSVAAMSGAIVEPEAFMDHMPLNGGLLCRNRDLPSDGTWIEPGEAFIMSGGGCPAAVVEGAGFCLVSHVGRESAIDRERLLGLQPRRDEHHMSVVDDMADTARAAGVPPEEMTLRVLFQIPTEAFAHPLDHPEHGAANRAMLSYARGLGEDIASVRNGIMYLDMAALVMAQARKAGFMVDDSVDYALPKKGAFGYTRHPNADFQNRRNLVIVQYLG